MEEALQIARDQLVRQRGRRHHHGHTIDELPSLFIGPSFEEASEQLDR
jgi:hypothetical protein